MEQQSLQVYSLYSLYERPMEQQSLQVNYTIVGEGNVWYVNGDVLDFVYAIHAQQQRIRVILGKQALVGWASADGMAWQGRVA